MGNMTELPPGSEEAQAQGCKCPVIDNNRGRGYMGIPGKYVIMGNCELHWPEFLETEVEP